MPVGPRVAVLAASGLPADQEIDGAAASTASSAVAAGRAGVT